MKQILSICLDYLTNLQPRTQDESSLLHTLLHMIVCLTSTSMWCAIHSNNSLQGLKPGLERLTENLVAHLLAKNVFNTMQVYNTNNRNGHLQLNYLSSTKFYVRDFFQFACNLNNFSYDFNQNESIDKI